MRRASSAASIGIVPDPHSGSINGTEPVQSLAMSIAGRLGDVQPVSRGRAYFLLAELFKDLDEHARAKELYELAIACAEEQAPSKHLVAAYRGLAELLKLEGHRDEALDLLERALNAQITAGIRI